MGDYIIVFVFGQQNHTCFLRSSFVYRLCLKAFVPEQEEEEGHSRRKEIGKQKEKHLMELMTWQVAIMIKG